MSVMVWDKKNGIIVQVLSDGSPMRSKGKALKGDFV